MSAPSPNGPNGRFAPGNPGGPGNPYARRVAALRTALLEAVTPEALGELARALVKQAKAGDVAAAKLVLSYLVGAPSASTVDPDRLEQHEAEVMLTRATARDTVEMFGR